MKAHHILPFLALIASARAQSTISSTDRFAHAANAGWIDFRPTAADGVRVTETYLSGKAYAANIGWIDFGSGHPGNGYSYANGVDADFGVNLSQTGALTGYAYSANVGWITFDQSSGQPRLDFLTGRFTGHAYFANLGWIALDSPATHLAAATIACPDTDADGIGDAFEMLYFHNLGRAGPASDSDRDGRSDRAEFIANTNPLDAQSHLSILGQTFPAFNAAGTKSIVLQFTSSANRLYTIERSTDLTSWADSGLGLFAGDPSGLSASGFSFVDGPRSFFRITAHKPLP